MLGKKNQRRKEMDAEAKRGEEGRKESKSQSSDEGIKKLREWTRERKGR